MAATDRTSAHDTPQWGLLGPLALSVALGVVLMAIAGDGSRSGSSWSGQLFWVAILLITAPTILRQAGRAAPRAERLASIVVLGIGLYLAKVCYAPHGFLFSDEFVHLRAANNLLTSGHLFQFDPLLPIVGRYPGLANVTAAMSWLTGWSPTTSGLVLIGTARVTLTLGLFLMFERLSASARVAGIACCVYITNANFLYWSAQYAYESLALPLAVLVIYAGYRSSASTSREAWLGCGAVAALAVVATHHLTAYALALCLLVWALVALLQRRAAETSRQMDWAPIFLGATVIAGIAVWVPAAAPLTLDYLGSTLSLAVTGTADVISGSGPSRHLFGSGGPVAPIWERGASVLATLAAVIATPFAVRRLYERRPASPLMVVMILLIVIYVAVLPLRLVPSAQETANRSTEFSYVGLGMGIALVALAGGAFTRRRHAILVGFVLVLLVGGVAVSWQYSERLPPRVTASNVDMVDSQAVSAARWTNTTLGPGRIFATDQTDRLALGSYGMQEPLEPPYDKASSWQVLLPSRLDASVREAVRTGHVEYAMVRQSLGDAVPSAGVFFDRGEPGAKDDRRPLSDAALNKFDGVPGVDRVFDSGLLQVYDLSGLGQ